MKNKLKKQIWRMVFQFTITLLLQAFFSGCSDNSAAQRKPDSESEILVALGFDQSLSVADFRRLDTGFVASVCRTVAQNGGGIIVVYGIGNATDKSGLRCYLRTLPEMDPDLVISKQAELKHKIKTIESDNEKLIRDFLFKVQAQIFTVSSDTVKSSDIIGFFKKVDTLLSEPQNQRMTRYVFAYTDGIQSLPGKKDCPACYNFKTQVKFSLCLAGWKAIPPCNFSNAENYEDPQGFLNHLNPNNF